MTVVRIQKIKWSEYRIGHIGKHKVSTQEAESVIYSDALKLPTYGSKCILVGRAGKRIISVIARFEGNKLEVVTARDASKDEREQYYDFEKNKTGS